MPHDWSLNRRASALVEHIIRSADELRIRVHDLPTGGRVLDFGVEAPGSLAAGRRLAEVCMAGLGDVSFVPGWLGLRFGEAPASDADRSGTAALSPTHPPGEVDQTGWPLVQVTTDHPVAACLLSQYAGWQISVGRFFGMGSGPMRAAAAREPLFEKLAYRESPPTGTSCVGVLEAARLPDAAVFDFLAERTGIAARDTVLLVAPTSSMAGNFQVVARSVETALHKLFELGFDVNRIASGYGTAPLAPVAADDLAGIGRTNDAILYGARVTLWVEGDDESLAGIGHRVPSAASPVHGKPFLDVFEDAGRDFYKIDPHLFSPAEVVFQNLDTGRVHRFGRVEPEILRQSFGLA